MVQLIKNRDNNILRIIQIESVIGLGVFSSVEISWQAVTFEQKLHGSVC